MRYVHLCPEDELAEQLGKRLAPAVDEGLGRDLWWPLWQACRDGKLSAMRELEYTCNTSIFGVSDPAY